MLDEEFPRRIRDFDKVLVANRGEIARRILRTLKQMGLASVAVFSDADREALHVQEADGAVRIGPAPSRESYLDQAAILEAARRTGAQAVHPGYGFLAENADFARRCREAGLVFIGPSAEAIARMGRKDEAKTLAESAGVPTLGGFSLDGLGSEQITEQATAIGFPLLIKAAAGGGGKGMRAVERVEDLADAIEAARREAESAFGDGALLVERFLEAPRHVEVQVFGDGDGNVVHLFERDCSVQRRHQKVFEEAPSPAVDEDLRRRMGEAAVALAKAVSYEGAGTVEFLLDAAGEFFFLEMNTRLQVEHPVTEMIASLDGKAGLDLVRLQVDVAQGKPLPFSQDNLTIDGHAVEARLYAEDPSADFLPVTGELTLWHEPELPGLRIDAGVAAGDRIGVHYDPLLAKVIAHGSSREQAVRRLRRGLEQLAVGGLVTNRDFLIAVLGDDDFKNDQVTTRFLAEHGSLLEGRSIDAVEHAIAGTIFLVLERRQRPSPLPAGVPRGWRNNRWRAQDQAFLVGDERIEIAYVERAGDSFEVTVGGSDSTIDVKIVESPGLLDDNSSAREGASPSPTPELALEIDGLRRRFRLARGGDSISVHGLAQVVELGIVPRFPARAAEAVAGGCAAPMTGLVVDVLVEEGDQVEVGAPLVILEAMKMEHRLEASFDGVVESVRVKKGSMVDPDKVLVVVVPHDKDGVVPHDKDSAVPHDKDGAP